MIFLLLIIEFLAIPRTLGFYVNSPLPNATPRRLSALEVRRGDYYNLRQEYDDEFIDDNRRGNFFDFSSEDDFERRYDQNAVDAPEWEFCDDDSTAVLLPPPYVSKPVAVIHFVGGTVFGSSPKLWYGSLLEEIVRGTNCAIVATSIPVTLAKNPLQHVKLSRRLQRQFQLAYVDILEDEYGEDIKDAPVVGMGHSLGARLLTVLATLDPPKNAPAPPYKNYILVSFTNYGASASIPGVQQLLKSRRKIDRKPLRRPRDKRPSGPSPSYDRYYDDDEWDEYYDEDFIGREIDIVGEIQDTVADQAEKFRDAVTPLSKELEFFPSPNQLWSALTKENRYSIPETLLIHFEDDEVDQSAKLANCLLELSDLKYALLRGTHLSPISVDPKDGSWMELPSRATKAVWDLLSGSKEISPRQRHDTDSEIMRDLRQTIIRYITDVAAVTK